MVIIFKSFEIIEKWCRRGRVFSILEKECDQYTIKYEVNEIQKPIHYRKFAYCKRVR